GVKLCKCSPPRGRVGRMSFVQNDCRASEAKHVTETLFYRRPAAPRAFGDVKRFKIWHKGQKLALRLEVVFRREESWIASAVLKHLQDLCLLARRRSHYHHQHAQVIL